MNLETVLVILAVVFAAVFNVILPWVKRQQENAQAGNADPAPLDVPPAVLVPAPSMLSGPESGPEPEPRRHATPSTAAPMALAAVRPARRSPVGSLSDMRNGIVLAAVLGPCRAQTPFV